MSDQSADAETRASNLDIYNRKYFILSIAIISIPGALMAKVFESFFMQYQFLSILLIALLLPASGWLASYLAANRYKKLKSQLNSGSLGLKRAHYIAIHAKGLACTFSWILPLAILFPVMFHILQIKFSTYLAICFAILYSFGQNIAAKKALAETGYSPPKRK